MAYYLIDITRKKLANDDFAVKGKVYAFDSTTIDLCQRVFGELSSEMPKAGIKDHTHYDITTQIPVFLRITEATVHDVKTISLIPYEFGSYYAFDRGYVEFKRLYKITQLN